MDQASNKKQASGFSLVETIISVAIFTLISLGIIALVSFIITNDNRQSKLLSNNEQATKMAFTVMRELRNAKPSINGAYPITTAGDQQLIFFTDTGTTIDRINYFMQGGFLKKGVTKPTGSPAIYNLAGEVVTIVQNDVANGATPLFYYYDDNYDGVTGNPIAQPVNVTLVRFIKIGLSVYNKGGVYNSGSYTVTAGAAIRNLKTNLGN